MSDNKVVNPNFFKRRKSTENPPDKEVSSEPIQLNKLKDAPKAEPKAEPKTESASKGTKVSTKVRPLASDSSKQEPAKAAAPIIIRGKINALLDETSALLNEIGQKTLLSETEKIRKELERKRFTVAVVGEFSRGKSTFINKLLGKDFLPTGNLPTTALLTKIRYSPKEMLILFDYKGNKQRAMPLRERSWDGLTADMFGKDPEGVVLAGVNSSWLKSTEIELEDTPGAGDLEQKRMKITDEALFCDDGAIITIDATAAFSKSEELFVEQRLISRKTPYLMIIITKLDMVPLDERPSVIEYINKKTDKWKLNIPVYVAYETEMPDDTYKDIMGLDKVKKELESWLCDPERVKLTEKWIAQRLLTVTDALLAGFKEQQALLEANDEKRSELIEKKKLKLSDASVVWDELRLEMLKRCKKCYEKILTLIDDNKVKITERLQYEASHSGSPEKWCKEDYPYRMKVELTNLSGAVENIAMRNLTEDARWFNSALNNNFRTSVNISQTDDDHTKQTIDGIASDENLEFEDLSKKRTAVRVGTAALTIASYCLLPALGINPIIGSVSLGTGTSVISEKIFRGKIEKQKEMLKESIAKSVPMLVDKATEGSQKRLEDKYNVIIESAREQEKVWMEAQKDAIESSVKGNDPQIAARLKENLDRVNSLSEKIKSI